MTGAGFIVGVLFIASATADYATYESIFNRTSICKKGSPDFNKCLKKAVEGIIEDLSQDGFADEETFDPWELDESLPFSYGSSPSDRIGVTLNEIALHGLSRTVVKSVRSNLKDNNKLRLEIDLFNPGLFLEGNYTVQLMSIDQPFSDGGIFNVTFSDVKGTLVLKGHTTMDNGVEYLKVDRASFKPEIGQFNLAVYDDNDPYPEMTEMVLSLVNTYWRMVYFEALPLFEEAFDSLLRAYLDDALTGVPFSNVVSA